MLIVIILLVFGLCASLYNIGFKARDIKGF